MDESTNTIEETPISINDTKTASPPPTPKQPNSHKKVIILITLLFIGIIAAAVTLLVISYQPAQKSNSASNAAKQPLMGAAITVIDGTAQISKDTVNWQDLTLESTISQGDTIRTSSDGRVIVTLDDGSALRVNSNSTVTLTSLNPNSIKVTNVSGEAYARVVTSDRTFDVVAGRETYRALGTAFSTTNTKKEQGVEVYQSAVKSLIADKEVSEGKRYFDEHSKSSLVKKVTSIPLDQLKKDDFLKWNLEHDKKSKEFKKKLGYLADLEKKAAKEATDSTPQPTPSESTNTSTSGISLSGSKTSSGVALTWTVSGLDTSKGMKVVKGLSANPTFGVDESHYVDANARNHSWALKDGKTYHFRVCIYTGSGCTNYSNNIAVTAPKYSSPSPSGSLTLQHVSGNKVKWTLDGSAPNGLKLVWSKNTSPTYPEDNAKYFSGESNSSATFDGDSGKTYYLRVCMYKDGACVNYSNQIVVTLP